MKQEIAVAPVQSPSSAIVPFYGRLEELGKTRATGHRWRKNFPWINEGICNVFGKLYTRRATIAEFEARALRGELYREIRPEVSK